jgi:hypothetical protein
MTKLANSKRQRQKERRSMVRRAGWRASLAFAVGTRSPLEKSARLARSRGPVGREGEISVGPHRSLGERIPDAPGATRTKTKVSEGPRGGGREQRGRESETSRARARQPNPQVAGPLPRSSAEAGVVAPGGRGRAGRAISPSLPPTHSTSAPASRHEASLAAAAALTLAAQRVYVVSSGAYTLGGSRSPGPRPPGASAARRGAGGGGAATTAVVAVAAGGVPWQVVAERPSHDRGQAE